MSCIWTVMVYMAGGGKTTDAARDSLIRMKQVASNKDFDIFVHFDFGRGKTTKRYHLNPIGNNAGEMTRKLMRASDHSLQEFLGCIKSVHSSEGAMQPLSREVCEELGGAIDREPTMDSILKAIGSETKAKLQHLCSEEEWRTAEGDPEKMRDLILASALEQDAENIGETNTGDPCDLRKFIEDVCNTSKGDHRMVIIWGHGDGLSVAWDLPPSKKGPTGPPKVDEATLTTVELKSALKVDIDGNPIDGERIESKPIDIVGFNACSMGMLEVFYQIRESVKLVIASEGFTPTESWPYDRIFKECAPNSGTEPKAIAESIVQEYAEHFGAPDKAKKLKEIKIDGEELAKAIDLSAGDLSLAKKVLDKLGVLVTLLRQKLGDSGFLQAISDARTTARLPFADDFVNLHQLCDQLGSNCPDVKEACKAVSQAVETMLFKEYKANLVKFSHGLSIYFPSSGVLDKRYSELDFCKDTKWDEFLKEYLRGRQKAMSSDNR